MRFDRKIVSSLALAAGLAVSAQAQAYEITLPQLNQGRGTFSTANHDDGVFVLEFFQNRCGGCITNAPKVNELAEYFQHVDRVHVLDVGQDPAGQQYTQWIAQRRPNHPVLGDYNRAVSRKFNIKETPTAVILNCRLEEKYRHVGHWTSADETAMRKIVSRLALETCRR